MRILGYILNSYQKFFNKRIQGLRLKRNILLYCASDTMLYHILDYCSQVKDNNKYNFFLYYGNTLTSSGIRREKTDAICKQYHIYPVNGKYGLILKHWDLIVTADLDYEPLRYTKDTIPILYVNHGSHIVSIDNEGTLYAYGKRATDSLGRCRFTFICEPNLRIAGEMNKSQVFNDRVIHTGAKDADRITGEADNYHVYRKRLGIGDNETAVAVFGTWRKESLFQYLGKDFLNEAGNLTGKGYRFILSVHPREYTKYDDSIEPIGPVLDEYAKKFNFIIRQPDENYIPYLIAADIVICDYSSLYENALLAGKKLIFSYFPDTSVGKLSIAYSLKREIKVLYKEEIGNLADILEKVKTDEDTGYINQYASEIYAGNGVYRERMITVTEKLLRFKGGFS